MTQKYCRRWQKPKGWIYDFEDIKSCNRYRPHPSSWWFAPDTGRFFRSRYSEKVYQGKGGIYFVTSEQFVGSTYTDPRRYTVRRFNPTTAGIDTAGPFNELSRAQAHGDANRYAKDGPPVKRGERY